MGIKWFRVRVSGPRWVWFSNRWFRSHCRSRNPLGGSRRPISRRRLSSGKYSRRSWVSHCFTRLRGRQDPCKRWSRWNWLVSHRLLGYNRRPRSCGTGNSPCWLRDRWAGLDSLGTRLRSLKTWNLHRSRRWSWRNSIRRWMMRSLEMMRTIGLRRMVVRRVVGRLGRPAMRVWHGSLKTRLQFIRETGLIGSALYYHLW